MEASDQPPRSTHCELRAGRLQAPFSPYGLAGIPVLVRPSGAALRHADIPVGRSAVF